MRPTLPSIVYIGLVLAFLYLPIGLLIAFSFNDSVVMSFPFSGFTLDWYRQLGDSHELLRAARNSALVGVISASGATLFGVMAAIALVRYRFWGRNLLLGLATVPLVLPSIVLGAGLLVFFRSILDVELSLGLIIASHIMINIPSSILIIMARLAGFSQNIEEAAMDLGATPIQTLLTVTLPLMLPAILASFLTAFTTSFDEYAMTTLITGTDITLPVYLYAQLRFPRRLPVTLALGSVIMVASAVLIVCAEWLRAVGLPAPERRRAHDRVVA